LNELKTARKADSSFFGTHEALATKSEAKPAFSNLTGKDESLRLNSFSSAQGQSSATSLSHIGKWYANDPAVCSNHPDDLNLGLLIYDQRSPRP